MSVLLIHGSPSDQSRSVALAEGIAQRLNPRQTFVDRLSVRSLPPQALLLADAGNTAIIKAALQVERAEVIVVGTPVYKAAYSGALKVFLDVLPQDAFKGKTVLPLATGGSPHHMLALDYALRPVLQSLGALHILPGVYASEKQLPRNAEGGYDMDEDVSRRLDEAAHLVATQGLRQTAAPGFAPIPFDQVRCSV
jgi:FMN reductase